MDVIKVQYDIYKNPSFKWPSLSQLQARTQNMPEDKVPPYRGSRGSRGSRKSTPRDTPKKSSNKNSGNAAMEAADWEYGTNHVATAEM